MKHFIKIFVLVCCFLTAVTAETLPIPPEVESEIGYLIIDEDINIVPSFKRFLILPQIDLLVLSEDNDAFHLVYVDKSSSFGCKIPKYARNMVLLRESDKDNFISFRGPIEVETIPIKLNKGEELPVKKKNEGNYVIQVTRKGVLLPIMVPDNTQGVVFSTRSEFAKFAEKQKKKGLSYFQGQWLPTGTAAAKKRSLEDERLLKEELWKSLKEGASHGVVVLKHGGVLNGKLSGSNDHNILFVSDNRDYFLSLDDTAPLSFEEIIARGKLDKAGTSLFNAKRNLKKDRGLAMYHAEQALNHLQGVNKKAAEEFIKSESMIAEVSSMIENIDKSLSKSGEAIYRNAVFPEKTLNYHLERGHVLLRRKIWLMPEQLCKDCHSSGNQTCADCKGQGRIQEDCKVCVKGRVVCEVCEGKGRRNCDYCGGKGYIYEEQKRSTVIASFGGSYYGRRYYPYYNPGTRIYTKDNIIAIKPYPIFYPCDRGSYFSIGNEEKAVKKVCPKCHGTGTLRCPKTIKCVSCQGVGYFIKTCATCEGKKKLTCKTCGGKGYIGSPQIIPEETTPVEEPKEGHSYFNNPVIVP